MTRRQVSNVPNAAICFASSTFPPWRLAHRRARILTAARHHLSTAPWKVAPEVAAAYDVAKKARQVAARQGAKSFAAMAAARKARKKADEARTKSHLSRNSAEESQVLHAKAKTWAAYDAKKAKLTARDIQATATKLAATKGRWAATEKVAAAAQERAAAGVKAATTAQGLEMAAAKQSRAKAEEVARKASAAAQKAKLNTENAAAKLRTMRIYENAAAETVEETTEAQKAAVRQGSEQEKYAAKHSKAAWDQVACPPNRLFSAGVVPVAPLPPTCHLAPSHVPPAADVAMFVRRRQRCSRRRGCTMLL